MFPFGVLSCNWKPREANCSLSYCDAHLCSKVAFQIWYWQRDKFDQYTLTGSSTIFVEIFGLSRSNSLGMCDSLSYLVSWLHFLMDLCFYHIWVRFPLSEGSHTTILEWLSSRLCLPFYIVFLSVCVQFPILISTF